MQKSGKKIPPNQLPMLYHAHHARHPEDIPFWIELAQKQGGPILELGCGTGRILIPLAEVCPSVFGLDNNSDMLNFLHQSLPDRLRSKVNIWLADLTAFHLSARFSLIALPCNTFSTLSREERHKMLTYVHHHLQPGGVFAACMPNPEYLAHLPAFAESEVEEIFPHPVDGEPVQVSSSWERTGKTFTIHWNYDHLLPDGRVDRTSAQARHYLESTQTYIKELSSAGYKTPILSGNFNGETYTSNAPYLIMLAARQS